KIFPKGLPEEFSIAAMFRVRRSAKKERWFLWQVLNQRNMPQVSVIVDGGRKVVELMFQAAKGDVLNYIFKNQELRSLFDRQWHKLGFGIQSQAISLYVDCNLVASRHTDAKSTVDFRGRTVIAARASDGKPVDIELHQLQIYCNWNFIAQETCCEISDIKCPEQPGFGGPAASPAPAHASRLSAFLPAKQELTDQCQCVPLKFSVTEYVNTKFIFAHGEAGSPGQKGEQAGLFHGGSCGTVSACNAGDLSSIPGLGRSPGERNGNPLQPHVIGPVEGYSDPKGTNLPANAGDAGGVNSDIVSDSVRPCGQQPTRLLHPQDSPGKNTGVGCQ
ncbi:hypothetical protein FD755_021722, partial [Muntiacus reevesi]